MKADVIVVRLDQAKNSSSVKTGYLFLLISIRLHLKNIYDSGELKEEATSEKISVVRREGNRALPS